MCLLWSLAAWGSEPPTLSIPPSQDPQAWGEVAELTGVRLVQEGADIRVLEAQEGDWLLVVVDHEGARHEVRMPAASDESAREELVWLGRSLLSPVTVPLQLPAPAPAPVALPTPVPLPPAPPVPLPEPAPRVRRLGMGLVLGLPSGVTGKAFLSRDHRHAIAVAAGSSELWLRWTASADYLWAPLQAGGRAQLAPRLGLGALAEVKQRVGYATVDNRPRAGARLPVGLDLRLAQSSFETYAEVAPTILLGLRSEVQVWAAFGARYYF
jgi:hypothetical protein